MRKFPKNSNSAVALDYANNVTSGKIPASWQVIAACQRFLDDFERDDIVFDTDEVDAVCEFASACPHVIGPLAGEPIKLEPFQIFILANIFGWLDRETRLRRYREAFVLLPRGNAKSTIAAIIALYMTFCLGQGGAEGLSGATSLKQANAVFLPAKRMVELTPEMAANLGLEVAAKSIYQTETGSSFQPVKAKPGDGGLPWIAITDELHEARDATQLNAFRTGMGKRKGADPLLLIISTAGTNLAGVCRQEQLYFEGVLAGTIKDDSKFALIYTIDPEDNWTDFRVWQKANPNYGVSVDEEHLQKEYEKALQSPSYQAICLTKYLNVWVSSASGWLTTQAWAKGIDESLNLEDFKGSEATLACDMSTRQDLTGITLSIRRGDESLLFPIAHLPEGALDGSPNANAYREWIDGGHLINTPGSASSFAEIEQKVLDLCRDFKIRKAIFDPWQGEFLRQKVASLGIETEIWPASAPAMWTRTIDDFEADLKNGLIKHPNHPVLNWCAANIALSERGVTRIPAKPQKHLKIDVMITSLLAYAALKEEAPEPTAPMLAFI